MTEFDEQHMREAISQAEQCRPVEDRIPKVGAVIAINGTVIGKDYRGTGDPDDDDHAERRALAGVVEKKQLPKATLYTTLEPCTPEVRSDPSKCCTALILNAEIKRVFIGIRDPNQGVRGKGLWELQNRGVEIELFPPSLARQIRALNDNFIRVQQMLGIRITSPTDNETIRTYDKEGIYEIKGKFLSPPGPDVFAVVNVGGQWWPQASSLKVDSENKWSVKVNFSSYGPHTVAIVRANELGASLKEYYLKVGALNRQHHGAIRQLELGPKEADVLSKLRPLYPGIEMARLPKGLELQDRVAVIVETPLK